MVSIRTKNIHLKSYYSAICVLALILLLLPLTTSAAISVAYNKTKSAGLWLNVVTVDLNDISVRVTPIVAHRGIGFYESFRSILRRTRPAAAIDGTFFCTRTFRPTGDIVIDGRLIYKGWLGTAIAFGAGRSVKFIPVQWTDNYRWSDYDYVLAAGPSLILNGKLAVMPRDQGFHSGVHFSRRIRTAIGLTSHNKLLLVTTKRPAYLSELAKSMRKLGCVDAAGLDGGSSTGLYCKGKLISNPSRGMTNCLLVYDDICSYEQHRNCFYPKRS